MCQKCISRRGLLAGAGAVLGAGLLPAKAQHKPVTALAITCMDFRLVDDAVRFFASQKLTNDYDQVSLAGASLAAVSPRFASSNAAFWDHVAIARKLHDIRKLIVMDHRDCGAYRVAFNRSFQGAEETEQHRRIMVEVKTRLAKEHPGLPSEFYLMALDGKTERLI
jgi:carbonic anhydrase